MSDEFVKIRVSIDYTQTLVYDNHDLEIEVKKSLLGKDGKLTMDAVQEWLKGAGPEAIGNSWEPEDGELSFSVLGG